MIEIIGGIVIIAGASFVLVAAIGVLRLPDILMRMHASTKAGTLGAGLILLSVAIFYGEVGVTTRAIATIAFLVLTAPVAAHVIGRAAYMLGIEFWEGNIIDEMEEHVQRADKGKVDAAPAGKEDHA